MTDRIRRTREQCGLSLAQAARLLGWAQGPLHAMEAGATAPTEADLRAMATLYCCSVAWLLGETAELSAENKALLNTIDTSDRATVREFMEMLSTRDPGGPDPAPASERLAKIAAQMAKPGLAASQPVSRKRRYVKSQGQTRHHHCHWPDCNAQVPPAMWGCKAHWFRLPKALRDRIWATYAPGQEVDLTPSTAYLQVADDVQRWIKENA